MVYSSLKLGAIAILLSAVSWAPARAQEVSEHQVDLAIATIQALQQAVQKSYITLSNTGDATKAHQVAIQVLTNFHNQNEDDRLSAGQDLVNHWGIPITAGSIFALAASQIANKSSADIAKSFLNQLITRSVSAETIAAMIARPGSKIPIFQYLLNPLFDSESAQKILTAFENVPGLENDVLEFERQYFIGNKRTTISPIQAIRNATKRNVYNIAEKLDHEIITSSKYKKSILEALKNQFGDEVVWMSKSSKLPRSMFVQAMSAKDVLKMTAKVTAVGGLAVVLGGIAYQFYLDSEESFRPMTETNILMYGYNQLRDYLSEGRNARMTLALADEARKLNITVPEFAAEEEE